MITSEVLRVVQDRLNAIQKRHNFNPDAGAAQTHGHPELLKAYGAFAELLNLVDKAQLEVTIPYDGLGLDSVAHAQKRTEQKTYFYMASNYNNPMEIKVGRSVNPYKRRDALQTANGHPIHVIGSYSAGTRARAIKIEGAVKRHLKRYLMTGGGEKWFLLSSKQVREVLKQVREGVFG